VDEALYAHRYDWTRVYWKSTGTRDEDYLRTIDYLFRYDKGVTNVMPRSFLGRLLLGRFLSSNEYLRLAQRFPWLMPRERPTITLDTFLPFAKVGEFLGWYREAFRHYPLWCVPYKVVRPYDWLADGYRPRPGEELYLDLAIYGMRQPDDGRNYYRVMEEKLMELGGVKTLISHNHYTEAEFWSVFHRENYERAKAALDPDHLFRDLYSKTCR
jgi:FAD/FMN-containing dehydrogenase